MQAGLGIASGALVGFSLGLIGGGGSILAVPLMVYVVGVADAVGVDDPLPGILLGLLETE